MHPPIRFVVGRASADCRLPHWCAERPRGFPLRFVQGGGAQFAARQPSTFGMVLTTQASSTGSSSAETAGTSMGVRRETCR